MFKVLYAGSPDVAAAVLETLVRGAKDKGEGNGGVPYQVVGVLTNPPSAQGRHKALISTPTAQAAERLGIRVFSPAHLDAAFRAEVSQLGADVLVCFAYSHIFGPKFLSMFPLGGVNLHPSLLPRYRGATPVPAAILHRDNETAVTVQRLALGMDEGDILAQERIALDGTETAGGLLAVCAERGGHLLCELLTAAAAEGCLPAGTPQTGDASYTKMLTKEDARIDWSMSAASIDAHIRAYTPSPGAWTMYRGEILRVLAAHIADEADADKKATSAPAYGSVLRYQKQSGIIVQAGDGEIAITMLQRQGKKAMDAASFANGERDIAGNRMGE